MTNYILLATLLLASACSGSGQASGGTQAESGNNSPVAVTAPVFNGDSAMMYVRELLSFGPRVPGTEAQVQAADWLQQQLTRHGATVEVQRTEATAYNGTRLPIINVTGRYNVNARMRVLILAHWDSRHIADNDPDKTKRNEPVMGANDGASGCGVMMELARLASQQNPQMGIDLLFTDAEDYGAPDDWKGSHDADYWALGTQAWCKAKRKVGYKAQYGILLDMVGAPDASFYHEYYSKRYAREYLNIVWNKARELGYSDLFIASDGAGVTDDHVSVNEILGVPCIDIIDTRTDDQTFYPHWHTTHDTYDKLSVTTIQKVGNVLTSLLWK